MANINDTADLDTPPLSHTQQLQLQFTQHIRNAELYPRPKDVPDRRMAVYRDLFYSNIENFISNGFPILRELIPDEPWHEMVRDFMTRHRCQSPYFREIPEEFLEYLQIERTPRESDLPYLIELAHYEWTEMALDISPLEIPENSSICDLLTSAEDNRSALSNLLLTRTLALSPIAWQLTYTWPVHKLSAEYQPTTPPEAATYLLVYRNRADEVKFIEMNPVTARLVTLLNAESLTGEQLIDRIYQELNGSIPKEAVHSGGIDTLMHLLEVDALYVPE